MIAMTLLLCLKSVPEDCHRENVAFQGSMMQCALFGQAAAAEHLKGRPAWLVKKIRCDGRPTTDA